MARFDIAPGLKFLSRSEWSPDSRYPRLGTKISRDKRTHVFIHHTCMEDEDDTPNLWEQEDDILKMMRELQICRKEDLGADVPYNFVAFMTPLNDGLYICEGRGEDRSGAHTYRHNTAAIAVSFAGNFEGDPIPSEEISRRMPLLSLFLGWLRFDPNHGDYGPYKAMTNLEKERPADGNRHVWYHRDVKDTDCPGVKLIQHLPKVTFARP